MEDDEMVQTLPSDRANEALAIRILPGGMRSGEHLVKPHRMGGCREGLAINSVTIAQQVAWRTIPGEGLDQLPGRPFCGGMRGYAKVKESAAIMRQNQKNEEQTESRRGNHKEVGRDQFLGMILEEGAPGLRGWLAVADHVLGDGRLREVDAEFLEFTMNARCTPTWVSGTHFLDQVVDVRRHRRSTVTNSALPFPIDPKALAVPSDDGLGFHNAQEGAPIGPNPGEPDPNESVARWQSQATVLVHALQQKKLVAECQVLSVQSGPSLKTATKGEEQGSEEYEHSIAPYHASPQAQRSQ